MKGWTKEDVVWWTLYERFSDKGWKIVGGQPPKGTSPVDVVRLRLKTSARGGFSGFIPDLIANKENVVIVFECKPKMSVENEVKLDRVFSIFSEDYLARKFRLIKGVKYTFIKCLSFREIVPKRIPSDFLVIIIHHDRSLRYVYGKSLIQKSLKDRMEKILP